MKVAVIFHRIGPYHFARLRVAGGVLPVVAIETSGADETYAWDKVGAVDGFERVTLFENADAQKQPSREVARRMASALDKIRPQVVVIPGWSDKAALAALQWCIKNQVPQVVMSESTAWDASRSVWREAIKRQIVGLASAALAGGTPNRDYLVQLGMPRESVFLGYDAVDNRYFADKVAESRKQKAEGGTSDTSPEEHLIWPAATFSPERRRESPQSGDPQQHRNSEVPSSPFFLASARFVEKKNLPRLIQAYASYRELASKSEIVNPKSDATIPEAHLIRHAATFSPERRRESPQNGEGVAPWNLVLLGDGELRPALTALRSALGLDACVHLPGFKQYGELPAFYAQAGAFIHASTTEQWGLVVNEAMASGLPVLVSNRCGCAQDLVQEGVNGFTFDPHNVEEMAQRMFQVSGFRFQVSEFGDASRQIISLWGPDRFASGLKDAVECALRVGPIKPALLQRALLAALLRR